MVFFCIRTAFQSNKLREPVLVPTRLLKRIHPIFGLANKIKQTNHNVLHVRNKIIRLVLRHNKNSPKQANYHNNPNVPMEFVRFLAE